LEKEKKLLEESTAEKDALLQKKVKTIGNYVHDSVPISNNEVHALPSAWVGFLTEGSAGQERTDTEMGSRGSQSREEGLSFTS
jgi:seryl-tRNA synthetase